MTIPVPGLHSEPQWRHRAKRRGLRLVRYRQAMGYTQYGPYGLVEGGTGRVVAVRLGPEDVERMLYGEDSDAAVGGGLPKGADGDCR